ncbi:pentapeptide repeat-containing protein [Oscillatoria amoena NRMC-F 0135]|nr:pentapeptide repeat-containing protein [Geitlerinema splendidum]MDL5045602.1 pentapeptide repeat-containing protein [Oscillatoria amoena NRMC-F 0135]
MSNSQLESSQPSKQQPWIDRRSCTIGCLGYVAGLITFPLIVIFLMNTPQNQKERLLEGRSQNCQNCDFSYEHLSFAQLNKVNLAGANLEGAILGAAQLNGANLSRANLKSAILRQAQLNHTNFEGADLTGAEFRCGAGTCTDLTGTLFINANLTRADFRVVGFTPVGEVGLEGVDFTGANLTEANFEGASLKGALLEQAKFCKTTMPDGTLSNRNCQELAGE